MAIPSPAPGGGVFTGLDPWGRPSLVTYYGRGNTDPTAWYNIWTYYQEMDQGNHDLMINRAIAAAAAAGGGTVYFPEGDYTLTGTIILQTNVDLFMQGAGLTWMGATDTPMVQSAADTVLMNMRWQGGALNANSISGVTAIWLQSPQRCALRDIRVFNVAGGSTPAIRIEASGSNGHDTAVLQNNAVANVFEHLTVVSAPIGYQFSGPGLTGGLGAAVTDNYFYGCKAYHITQIAMRFVQWSDNNYFYGTWLSLDTASPTGIVFNDSATPAGNVGVYANHFWGLGLDTFGTLTATAVRFNWCFGIEIRGLFGPLVSTTIIEDVNGQNYLVEYLAGFNNAGPPYIQQKNWRAFDVGTAPALGALQAGIASQTLTVAGYPGATDRAGLVQITATGAPPAAGAVVAILAFATPYNSKVLVFLQDQNASAIFGRFYGDGTTTALTIRCAAALTAGATYTIVYHVVGA